MRIIRPSLFLGLAALLSLFACDSDFNELGTNIIGDDHYQFGSRTDYEVNATSMATGPVQTNNLSTNPLGIYSDPVFGKMTASYVTQLEMASPAPTIGTDPQVVNVILSVPYNSTLESTDTDGSSTYTLNNVFEKAANQNTIQLDVYRSGYYLRSQDIGAGGELNTQYYYNDQNAAIDGMKVGNRLNNATANNGAQNDHFKFSPEEHVIPDDEDDTDEDPTYVAPGIRFELDAEYFEQTILNASATDLASNDAFKNYFRGLYFKVSPDAATPTNEAMSLLNFSAGTITINYTTAGATSDATRIDRSIVLNLAGNSISLRDNENAPTTVPDGRLYVRGGEGFVTQLDLFGPDSDGDGVPDSVEQMREENWMINEASLTFYVDETAMADVKNEPLRIYLYDMDNKQPIIDYSTDNTTIIPTSLNKYVFDGTRSPLPDFDPDENTVQPRATKYRVRLTNYLRNLISNDSTNVRLGLSVTNDISVATMARRKAGYPGFTDGSFFIPTASVLSPFGTVLHGPNSEAVEKRLKLVVYYTKPSENQ